MEGNYAPSLLSTRLLLVDINQVSVALNELPYLNENAIHESSR
jgi:hypothetical protein